MGAQADILSQVLVVALIVVALAAIWALYELVLTLKKARSGVDSLTRSVEETVDELTPLIAKIDGLIDDVQPALKAVDPLVEQTTRSLSSANESLEHINVILGDVEQLSASAKGVSSAVNQATSFAAQSVYKMVDKFIKPSPDAQLEALTGDVSDDDASTDPAGMHAAAAQESATAKPSQDSYVCYPQSPAVSAEKESTQA